MYQEMGECVGMDDLRDRAGYGLFAVLTAALRNSAFHLYTNITYFFGQLIQFVMDKIVRKSISSFVPLYYRMKDDGITNQDNRTPINNCHWIFVVYALIELLSW